MTNSGQTTDLPLRIAMTGASGLVGHSLTSFLVARGNLVVPLERKQGGPGIFWDPVGQVLDKSRLEGFDAVIHLAGENIGAGRWTRDRKEAILRSRVDGTGFLSKTLASLDRPPKTFLVASAIGFYGNRGEETLDEDSAGGKGFLPEACRAWEEACGPAREAGLRVVNVRTGIVLSRSGGALAKMLPPFRLGLGGPMGSGRQWMSWISIEDLVGIFHFLLRAQDLSGPVNAVAPAPVTNAEFGRILGKALHRPAVFPLPGFMVKVLLGEMGEALLLEGQKVIPAKLQKAGFRFLHGELGEALSWEIGG